jgi:anti-anti-sigma factor
VEQNFVFCTQCGYTNTLKHNFCSRCGERLKDAAAFAAAPAAVAAPATAAVLPDTRTCPNCNAENPDGAEFCKHCSMPITKHISVDNFEDMIVITLNAHEIDFENHTLLQPIFKAVKRKRILIDLNKVKWMDSTAIGTLVSQTYRAARTKQEIKFVGMGRKIFEAVKALSVDNVLDIYPDINAARAAWGLPPF